jgi:hypothetical protein
MNFFGPSGYSLKKHLLPLHAMRTLVLPFLLLSIGAIAQSPKSLTGLEYQGTAEAVWQDGCEGCGNPGHIKFLKDNMVDYSLPGSDTPNRVKYSRKGDRIALEPGDWTMELKGDSLFFTAYNYRHSYIRVRK